MKSQILAYINENTNRESLNEKSTKQVATKFSLPTKQAYSILLELSTEGLITKLPPVNGDNFDCCGWIRNIDPE